MKKIIFNLMIILVAAIGMTSCSYENIDDTNVGVCIKRPYIWGSDESEVLLPGRHVVAWSSSIVPMNNTPLRFKESFTDLATTDKSNVDFDFNFNIKIVPDQAHTLYGKFGLQWYETNLQSELRRVVRETAMKFDMEALTSDDKITKQFEEIVFDESLKIIKELKIPVVLINVSMGASNPPDEVKAERNKTAAAKQREKTLVQENKNLEQQESNEKKRAAADKAYQKELNLTTDQYIKLRELDVKKIAYEKASEVIVNESNTQATFPIRR